MHFEQTCLVKSSGFKLEFIYARGAFASDSKPDGRRKSSLQNLTFGPLKTLGISVAEAAL